MLENAEMVRFWLIMIQSLVMGAYVGFLAIPLCVLWKMHRNGLYPKMTISFESLQELKKDKP